MAAAGGPARRQARPGLEAAFPAAPRPVPAMPLGAPGQGDGAAADAAERNAWTRIDDGQLSAGSAWVEMQAAWQARRSRRSEVAAALGRAGDSSSGAS